MAFKNIILIGAGGNLGPFVLNALTSSPHGYNVSVLSRESSSYQAPSGVKLIKSDYSHDSLVSAFKGQDVIVSTIGGQDFTEQVKIIDAAIAASVKRIVPSEFGSDTSNPIALQIFPPWNQKQKVREYLKTKEGQIEWTAIFTGLFIDWSLQKGFLGFSIPESKATFDPKYKDVGFSGTTLNTVGVAVAQALSPSIAPETKNKILKVRSVTTSLSELLAALEEATGKKWTVNEIDLDAAVQEAGEKIKKHDYSGVGHLILGAVFDERTGNNWDRANAVANGLLQIPNETVSGIVKSVL